MYNSDPMIRRKKQTFAECSELLTKLFDKYAVRPQKSNQSTIKPVQWRQYCVLFFLFYVYIFRYQLAFRADL